MVGREKEIADLIEILQKPEAGLVTLHGLGGTGKTRLAVEAGRAALPLFTDGVWFVALAPLTSAKHIVAATATALRFSFQSHEDPHSQLIRFLQGKRLLLIFDNLEHLLPEGSTFLENVLQNAADARLIVTSRQPINAPWERVYPLQGLAYEPSPSGANGEEPAAVQLFLQHLSRVAGPDAEHERACATQICQIVRGLPLALLLAASWGRALGCEEIITEIQRGIGFLQTQQKAFPERHSSMQAVFDYSWRLLSEREQAALRKLSIFRGGFDRHAAAQVAGADLNLLASFIDHAFVERVSKDRYQIHELLRQYLQDRLTEAGEEASARDGHLAYYVQLVEQAEPELMGKHQKERLAGMQLEIDNIRSALDWVLSTPQSANAERGLRMIVALHRFWLQHSYIRDGYRYLLQMLALQPDVQSRSSQAYGSGLNLAAKLSFLLEDLPATRRFAEEALRLGIELDDPRMLGDAYFLLGIELFHRTEVNPAQPLFERALENYHRCKYLPGIAEATCNLGRVDIFNKNFSEGFSRFSMALDLARKQEDTRITYAILRSLGQLGILDPQNWLSRAKEYYAEGLRYAYEMDDKRYVGRILSEMGELARLEGDFAQAAALFEQADSISSELGEVEGKIDVQLTLGLVYLRLGNYEQSQLLFLNNLAACQREEHLKGSLLLSLLGCAGLMAGKGRMQLAVQILGALEAHREQFDLWPLDKIEYERIATVVQAQLAEKQFNQLYKEGQALSLAEAAQLVQSQAFKETGRDVERLNDLTKREIEILRLVAQGLSDAQVAERLVLSSRTVNAHLTSVYRKLGVNSRAAATRFAVEHGLA